MGAGSHHWMDQSRWLEATGGHEGKLVPHSREEGKRRADTFVRRLGGELGLVHQQETQAPNLLTVAQDIYRASTYFHQAFTF